MVVRAGANNPPPSPAENPLISKARRNRHTPIQKQPIKNVPNRDSNPQYTHVSSRFPLRVIVLNGTVSPQQMQYFSSSMSATPGGLGWGS